jgi:Ca-activated chloride channel family protein
VVDNPFRAVMDEPRSTFSIDVDTASYSNMRRFLSEGRFPPRDAIRIEEMVNYFDYDYTAPTTAPFGTDIEVAACPWAPERKLVRIGLKGRVTPKESRDPMNLVFLIDVSGSMGASNKLPLLKQGMKMLVGQLNEYDRVAIVVYAGASGLVLPSTGADEKRRILESLDRLSAGGSTNGGAGIELAYKVAQENFIKGGINRVILCTDGDFNVGTTNNADLVSLIEEKRESDVFLSVLGFGMGNYNDAMLEKLADHGNGNYAYIDTLREAKKVLVEEMGATLVTIARDVKVQVEFNPAEVQSFRLIGYVNRILDHEDFNDDAKDAGEIGEGHTVTALYEIVPVGTENRTRRNVDPLKYQTDRLKTGRGKFGELMTIKLRYKQPNGGKSILQVFTADDAATRVEDASPDYQFAAAVTAFGMLLRKSNDAGTADWDMVLRLAKLGLQDDPHGYRAEFVQLVRKVRMMSGGN